MNDDNREVLLIEEDDGVDSGAIEMVSSLLQHMRQVEETVFNGEEDLDSQMIYLIFFTSAKFGSEYVQNLLNTANLAIEHASINEEIENDKSGWH